MKLTLIPSNLWNYVLFPSNLFLKGLTSHWGTKSNHMTHHPFCRCSPLNSLQHVSSIIHNRILRSIGCGIVRPLHYWCFVVFWGWGEREKSLLTRSKPGEGPERVRNGFCLKGSVAALYNLSEVSALELVELFLGLIYGAELQCKKKRTYEYDSRVVFATSVIVYFTALSRNIMSIWS